MPAKIKKPARATTSGEQKLSTNKNFRLDYTPDPGDLQYVGIVYLAEDQTGNRFSSHATLHIARHQYGELIHWKEYHLKGKNPQTHSMRWKCCCSTLNFCGATAGTTFLTRSKASVCWMPEKALHWRQEIKQKPLPFQQPTERSYLYGINHKARPHRRTQSPSEPFWGACTPEVQFPISCTKPRQTAPEEALVVPQDISEQGVRLRLIPDPAAIVRIMDETFGEYGWTRRYYFADGRLWCGVGVYHPLFANYAIKDAAAPAWASTVRDSDKGKEDGSFMAAAALWGAGSDIMSLKPLSFKADQVSILPIHKKPTRAGEAPVVVGYRLGSTLHVDKLLRNDAGRIIGVQLMDKEGRKAVWQDE